MANTSRHDLRWPRMLLRAAAPLVPSSLRDDWRREWEAELIHAAEESRATRATLIRRSLGAFADATWLRQRSIADVDWIDDLRYGWRQLREHAGFAVTATGILALGIAATVTMFSVTDQVLLRRLPYPEPERIVTLWETGVTTREIRDVAPGNFLDWRERTRSFEHLAAADPWAVDYMGGSHPEVFFAMRVTEGFVEAFGVRPLHGRLFLPEEYQKGRGAVVLLHETFWRQRFGGDPSIVGTALPLDDGPHVVVGILPADFEPRLLSSRGARSVLIPKAVEEFEQRIRSSGFWNVVGRVKPGVAIETAQAEMTTIARQIAVEQPRTNASSDIVVRSLREHLVGDIGSALWLLVGAVALVLLIACVNVANLLLARSSAREREVSIRMALGARRGRIVRQLLLESLLVAGIGCLAGLVGAHWALEGLARIGPSTVPWITTLHLDARAVAFAIGLSIVVALISGTLPALRAAQQGLASAGRQTTTADPRQHRLRAGLVVGEVALALMLVSAAGLLLRSFTTLLGVDPGFDRHRVLVMQVFAWNHSPRPDQLRTFFGESLRRLRALPAAQAAGAVSAMPFIEANINIESGVAVVGHPAVAQGEEPRAFVSVATPGYLEAMQIPLRRGRLLADSDAVDRPMVAVVSEELVRRHWSTYEDPIGAKITFQFSGRPRTAEIIGVVASLRHDQLDRPSRPEIFVPHAQMPFGSMTFVVRTAGDPASVLEPAKAAIWSVSPAQSFYRTATLDELLMRTVTMRRFALATLMAFAAVALLLSAAGVYGVLAAVTSARLREVGVRVALGASWWDISRWVIGRGLLITATGIVFGVAGALGASTLLRRFLFEVAPADPLSLGGACVVMLLAALAACYIPARRAADADPIVVLRSE